MFGDEMEMKECIDSCNACSEECEYTLFQVCLKEGGKHMEPEHIRLMSDCIEICQTAARFMIRGSDQHALVCEACAEICEACAESCSNIGGEDMEHCADICRECADSCREMGKDKSQFVNKGNERSGIMA